MSYKDNQKKFDKMNRMVQVPRTGMTFNPMNRYPRNSDCPCGSGKKYKKCHMNQASMAVDKKDAAGIKAMVDHARENPDVKFEKE